ncbi:MAG: MarR family transcriptional regulator [Hyphomicrobiales bacterium]|nr:MarR family transcriptional regulator [Hyphomicrobiales bacterium]
MRQGGILSDLDIIDIEAIVRNEPKGGKRELRLWLRLLSTSNLIASQIRRNLRDKFDVTLPRFDLMAQLYREQDGLRLSELSKRMMVSNGNVTGLVERLVQEGLVLREVDPEDRRAFIVRLSKSGMTKFAAYAKENERFILALFQSIDPATIDALMGNLERLKKSARENAAG